MNGPREEDGTDSTPPKSTRSRRRKGSRSPTSRHYVRAKEPQAEVIRLAKEGWSLEEIAKQIGYADRSGAWRALKAALSGLAQPDAEEYRKIQNEKSEHLYASLRRKIKEGNPAAVHAAIAVLNHQAKLNGIAVPKKVAFTSEITTDTIEEWMKELEEEKA